jgi:hypothetical protein
MASCKGIGYTASLFAIASDPTVLDKYLRNSGVMFADKKRKDSKESKKFQACLLAF